MGGCYKPKIETFTPKECKLCGKPFLVSSSVPSKIYCSNECTKRSVLSGITLEKTCPHCNIQFKTSRTSKIFCSEVCCKSHERISRTPKLWPIISEYCLERDNYKCSVCGCTDSLVVHHIVPLVMGGNHEYINLITLCEKCHRQKHMEIINSFPTPER
jgi:hypothetical protein